MNEKRPITFNDLIGIPRVSAPAVHPSGRYIAYVLSRHDPVKNKVNSTIMLHDIEKGSDRELTPGDHKDSSPSWSPGGDRLAFISDREGGSQIWILPFSSGGEAYRITSGDGGVSNPTWAPDSKRIAFSRSVVVSPHWDGNTEGLPSDEKEKERLRHARTYGLVNDRSSARIESSLLYRHWDHWRGMTRSHLFLVDIDSGEIADITPGDADVPPISLGGAQDLAFSPDGREIAYVKNPDPVVAISTNNSVFRQTLDGIHPVGDPVDVTGCDAMELEPRYTPDGSRLLFLGADRPRYEADRLRIRCLDIVSGAIETLTEDLDRSASDPVWHDDRIFFLAQDKGGISLYSVDLKGRALQHSSGTTLTNLRSIPGSGLLAISESMTRPGDLSIVEPGEGFEPDTSKPPRTRGLSPTIRRLTNYGDLPGIDLPSPEEFWYDGADGDPIHGFLLRPPGFKEGKTYPLLFIIHGGPQSAFLDNFHYRWNPQLFASEGYVVSLINPRGSTGYGQDFTDQISGDWGGRCYEDLMKGLDHLLGVHDFIDPDRIAALGASFGGFMVNWIAGHTQRFKALVSHDGIFNQETMSYMTEELWFDIWEHGGMPHQNIGSFRKYSPHLFVEKFRTPMLVIQGEQDFRCPVSEGISLFTALQVMKVPSKLLYFPDEGHWVTKPANSQVWYHTIMDFLKEHLG